MKMKKVMALTMVVFFTLPALAVTQYEAPNYSNCALITIQNSSTDASGNPITTSQQVVDPKCITKTDKAAKNAAAIANSLPTDAAGNLVNPIQPTYSTCVRDSADYYGCSAANEKMRNYYNDQSTVYNLVQKQMQDAEAKQPAQVAARLTNSTTDLVAGAEQKAREEQARQRGLSSGYMNESIILGVTYLGTCTYGCVHEIALSSAAALVMSLASKKQAYQNELTAHQACTTYNQLSSSGKQCGEVPPPVDLTKPDFPYAQVNPETGLCRDSAPPSCKTNLATLTDKGVDIRSVLAGGPNQFAGVNTPFKINKDGSITTKDGKTFSAKDFADEKSMIAAGISPADAKKLMDDLYGKDGVLAKAGLDAQKDLNALNKGLGNFDMGSGSTTTIKSGAAETEKSGLGVKDLSKRHRTPAGDEGLVKNFNGDSIGIANDDIFKMMNKRYILKSTQDSFIGQ